MHDYSLSRNIIIQPRVRCHSVHCAFAVLKTMATYALTDLVCAAVVGILLLFHGDRGSAILNNEFYMPCTARLLTVRWCIAVLSCGMVSLPTVREFYVSYMVKIVYYGKLYILYLSGLWLPLC